MNFEYITKAQKNLHILTMVAMQYNLAEDIQIKGVAASYFLATKLEAFKSRGNNDYFASHDFVKERIEAISTGL